MHPAKLMTVLSVCICLCGPPWCLLLNSPNAFAQQPQPVEADRPTQRWLPLPQGDAADLSEQAQLLQQLRDLISSESGSGASDSPLPKLSEQQLREMEKALDSMRELIGEDKLPNLESIPKEWIDQALADPILRKQAQQLLEQYARDRKLPRISDGTPRNTNSVPFPRRQPSDKTGQNSKSNPKSNPNLKSDTSPKSNSLGPDSNRELFPPIEDPFANNEDPKPAEPTTQTPGQETDLNRRGSGQPTEELNQRPSTLKGNRDRTTGSSETRSSEAGPSEAGPSEAGPSEAGPSEAGPSEASSSEAQKSADRSLPSAPDAERIQALQELFKKLKTIEGQRSPATNVPNRNPNTTNLKAPNQPTLSSGNGPRSTNSASPRSEPKPAMPPRTRSGLPPASTSPQDSPSRFSPSQPSDAVNGRGGTEPSSDPALPPPDFDNSNTASDPTNGAQANQSLSEIQKKIAGTNNSTSPSRPGIKAPVGSRGSSPNPLDTSRSARPGMQSESSASGAGSAMQDADIKTQLERHGLGRALQSIVEKTMKEQGEATAAKTQSPNKNSGTQPKAKDNWSKSNSQPASPSPSSSTASRTPPKNPEAMKNKAPATAPYMPSSNPSANTPSMMSGWRDTASQFWGAIRSAPSERSSGASSSPNSYGNLGGFEFAWNGRAWLVLGLVVVLSALLLVLARKRVVLASAAKEAEAELAREILTEGIRTRADVVRAFHRFVLRRTQPVADWWNHRYVAAKLSDASPQLRTVISDLASVYEHARYLPPEVKLSSEEIDRVQTALKQCAASSV